MNAKPSVSVIVTTYNHREFIGHCLDSVQAQRVDFGLEVLVFDDASTDGTVDILLGYAERHPDTFRLVLNKENQFGLGKSNPKEKYDLCRGDFIARIDGDDYWSDPQKLSKQRSFLLQNPEYVLSFHRDILVDQSGVPLRESVLPPAAFRDSTSQELRVMKWGGWMLFGTIMHRNVPLDFPPEYRLAPNGDNFFPILLAPFGGAKFQGDVGPLCYRQHGTSGWSSRTPEEQTRMELRTALQIAAYYARLGEQDSLRFAIENKLLPKVSNWHRVHAATRAMTGDHRG